MKVAIVGVPPNSKTPSRSSCALSPATCAPRILRWIAPLVLVLGGCSARPPASALGDSTIGEASWYGLEERGRLTANGESMDPEAMTAAPPDAPVRLVGEGDRPRTPATAWRSGSTTGDPSSAAGSSISRTGPPEDLGILRRGVARVMLTYLELGERADLVGAGRGLPPGFRRKEAGRPAARCRLPQRGGPGARKPPSSPDRAVRGQRGSRPARSATALAGSRGHGDPDPALNTQKHQGRTSRSVFSRTRTRAGVIPAGLPSASQATGALTEVMAASRTGLTVTEGRRPGTAHRAAAAAKR